MATIDAALDATPGEAYAAQRARRFRWLRFAPRLEGEYLAHMRIDQRMSTLVCTTTAMAIWLVFSAFDLSRLDMRAEFIALHRDVILIAALRLVTLGVLMALIILLIGPRLPRWRPDAWVLGPCATLRSKCHAATRQTIRDL